MKAVEIFDEYVSIIHSVPQIHLESLSPRSWWGKIRHGLCLGGGWGRLQSMKGRKTMGMNGAEMTEEVTLVGVESLRRRQGRSQPMQGWMWLKQTRSKRWWQSWVEPDHARFAGWEESFFFYVQSTSNRCVGFPLQANNSIVTDQVSYSLSQFWHYQESAQTPQVKGSILKDCPHFRHKLQ